MTRRLVILSVIFLTACGGGSGGFPGPTITDVQVAKLRYGTAVIFQFFGSNLASPDNGIIPTVSNCANFTPAAMILGEQDFRCTVTAVGDLTVQVKDKPGNVIFTKTFTVPAPQVTIDTTMGSIVAELDPTAAPKTVNNFLAYVQLGFYPQTLFHRVIPGFVIEGGGYTTGLVAKSPILSPIALETPNGLTNLRGTLAMARTSVFNSGACQFYFNLVDNPSLDYQDASNPGYAVFGKIVSGLPVMDAIGAVPTTAMNGLTNVPVSDVVITAVTQTQ